MFHFELTNNDVKINRSETGISQHVFQETVIPKVYQKKCLHSQASQVSYDSITESWGININIFKILRSSKVNLSYNLIQYFSN